MVIGNGMIAQRFSAFEQDNNHIIFASGVSNSSNKNKEPFEREAQMLVKTIHDHPEKKLVYFSTCSIYDISLQGSLYVQHKLLMEEIIKMQSQHYCIFRVSNPVGVSNNTNTVLNYFIYNITRQIHFEVWKNASRNVIDLDDMYLVCDSILSDNSFSNATVNVANPKNEPVTDIIGAIENHFCVEGNYDYVNKGNSPKIDVNEILPIFQQLHIHFDEGYLNRILQKYYPLA